MENQKPLSFTKEEIARIKARRIKDESKEKITAENLIVAEMGILYGWEAVKAILNDEIDTKTMLWLLEAGRIIKAKEQYNDTTAVFTAVVSANQKKPSEAFEKNTEALLKQFKDIT